MDYVGAGVHPLRLERHYNTISAVGSGRVGAQWRHTYDRSIHRVGTQATVIRADGKTYVFSQSGSDWVGPVDVMDRLVQTGSGWIYYSAPNDEVETYDVNGRLTSIANRTGVSHVLGYDGRSRLFTVTHSVTGGSLVFRYDGASRVFSVTDPASQSISYGYDGAGNLQTVTYPGGIVRTYVYNESAHTSGLNLPNFLTGIVDENSVRYATYKYDSNRRAISTEHAGTTSKYAITYTSAASSTVTDPLGKVRTLSAQTLHDVPRHTGVNEPCDGCGLAATIGYDANGYLGSATNFNGKTSTYVHNARGLETQRIEAVGTAQQRTISTEWHSTFRLVKKLAEPKRLTTYVFNGEGINCGPAGAPTPAGLICKKTVQATTDSNGSAGLTPTVTGTPREWTYTYNADGQVLTENGPRTDVSDVTTYTYHASGATCAATVTGASATGCRGQVNTVTNALSQTTTVSEYNAHGQPVKITSPNGLVTTLAYDARMRLTSRDVGGEVTTYEYWPTGLLKKLTNPDGTFLSYTYDDAHRLVQIQDSMTPAANRIVYTLDAMGNRIKEEYFAGSTLVRQLERQYNNLNRLVALKGGATPTTQVTQYAHDNQGNVTKVTMPFAYVGDSITTRSYDYGYDALNRLVSTTEPPRDNVGGTPRGAIAYQYDLLDQLTQVTDPRGLITTYTVGGLGTTTSQGSPDSGTTTFTYDAAGNQLTLLDSRGQQTNRTFDALNRLSFQNRGLGRTYTYDSMGLLIQLVDDAGTTVWTRNTQGRVTNKAITSPSGFSKSISYTYQTNGRVATMTYPSGRVLGYTYDTAGRIASITADGVTLISNITYQPFGPAKGWTWGSGATYSRTFDLDGRITSYPLGTQTRNVSYDAANRIGTFTHPGQSALDETFVYDNLDRLVSSSAAATPRSYTYDLTGNRTAMSISGNAYSYTIAPTSNRVSSMTGPGGTTNFTYDAAGDVTGDGTMTLTYNAHRQLQIVTKSGQTHNYLTDGWDRRTVKWGATALRHIYDDGNHLIGEYNLAGTVTTSEYVYLGDIPIAVLKPGTPTQIYYIFSDHLNTPRVVTNSANISQIRWRWLSEPFGTAPAEDNPLGLGVFTFNLRFPGQYYDAESALHNNYHRDYDPKLGRYIQSDPIGLQGGINTYAYVGSNPLTRTDPRGLQSVAAAGAVPLPRPPAPAPIPGTGNPPSGGEVIPFPGGRDRPSDRPDRPGSGRQEDCPEPDRDPLCNFTGLAGFSADGPYGGFLTCQYQCPRRGLQHFTVRIAFTPQEPRYLCRPAVPESFFR